MLYCAALLHQLSTKHHHMATSAKAKKKTVRLASGRKRARQDVKLNAANTSLRSQVPHRRQERAEGRRRGDKAKATELFKAPRS